MRQEEIQAVSEALAILSSDDAHDTFTSAQTRFYWLTGEWGTSGQRFLTTLSAKGPVGTPGRL